MITRYPSRSVDGRVGALSRMIPDPCAQGWIGFGRKGTQFTAVCCQWQAG